MEPLVFYILETHSADARMGFVAKLVNKVWGQLGHRVLIRLDDAAQRQAMSESLWALPDSFLAHDCEEGLAAIRLALVGEEAQGFEVLINLSSAFDPQVQEFMRVVEVLDADESRKVLGRQRYRDYQGLGMSPVVHKIPG